MQKLTKITRDIEKNTELVDQFKSVIEAVKGINKKELEEQIATLIQGQKEINEKFSAEQIENSGKQQDFKKQIEDLKEA